LRLTVEYVYADSLFDLGCEVYVLDARGCGILRRRSRNFASKMDEVLANENGYDQLLGKALVYHDVKVSIVCAAIFIDHFENDRRKVDWDACRRALTQVYNYCKTNGFTTIGTTLRMCRDITKPIDFDLVLDDLFRHTQDIEVKVVMNEGRFK